MSLRYTVSHSLTEFESIAIKRLKLSIKYHPYSFCLRAGYIGEDVHTNCGAIVGVLEEWSVEKAKLEGINSNPLLLI